MKQKSYKMNKVTIKSFSVIGISVRTTNENGQAKKDIGELWGKFMSEKMLEKIPNIKDETIYAIYTDYEGDYTKPYTTILGYKVNTLDVIPDGMVGIKIEKEVYNKFVAKGDLTDDAVIGKWVEIWGMDIDRAYTADFEMYGEKAIDPTNGEAEIYIAIKG